MEAHGVWLASMVRAGQSPSMNWGWVHSVSLFSVLVRVPAQLAMREETT